MPFELTQPLHQQLLLCPDAQAACAGAGDRQLTYRQLHVRAARFAGTLRNLCEVEPGDRVGILALNSPDWLVAYFGCWWAGAAVVPLNTRWSEVEIDYALHHAGIRVLVVDRHTLKQALALPLCQAGALELIWCDDGPPLGAARDPRQHPPIADRRSGGSELAALFYTGGTTGHPKAVMLSHDNLYANALQALLGADLRPDDRVLQVVPLFHLAGLSLLLRAVIRGAQQVIPGAFEPHATLRLLAAHRITVVLLVPTMMQMLVDHRESTTYDLRQVRMVGYGAAPISEALLERALPIFPNASFQQGYGQSELSPCLTILSGHWHTAAGRAQANKLRSAGVPLPGCEIRIVDADGIELPSGQVGEVVARSPGVMLGYWKAPAETAQALRNGWLHTGDVGFLDADGFLTLVDRLKDLIVSGGENVYSAEVENALASHPAVAACAVIGIPDPRWGEAVHAVVVPRDPANAPEPAALIAHCRARIAGYKCPRSVEWVPALPLSPVGKVLKYQLREPYWRAQGRNVA